MAERKFQNASEIEQMLLRVAGEMNYPKTPDIASAVDQRLREPDSRQRPRRWATVAASLIVTLAVAMAIPPVRSSVVEWVRAGAIWVYELTTGDDISTNEYAPSEQLLLRAAEYVTLDEAEASTPFAILLPTYPQDLAGPDEVYLQRNGSDTAVYLIWRDAPGIGKLGLSHLEGEQHFFKGTRQISKTTVSGQPAIWAEGPHLLRLRDGSYQMWSLVEGHVLIWWSDDGPTYRLESHLPLAESIRVAESLRPYQSMEE